jgi:hypothetical protein
MGIRTIASDDLGFIRPVTVKILWGKMPPSGIGANFSSCQFDIQASAGICFDSRWTWTSIT